MTYYILIKYYYYPGSYGEPKDGALLDCNDKKKLFSSKELASNFLLEMNMINYKDDNWCVDGIYVLNHGEYAEPTYIIRKSR